jgi:hypothetical protein
MIQSARSTLRATLLAAACCAVAEAQAFPLPPVPKIVLITARFRAPLTSAIVLDRLDRFYDEQVGRKLALALPEISPNHRYEIWHDMWVDFEPSGDSTGITLKRPTAPDSNRLAKGWMLELAGRLEAPLPLEFLESTPMHLVSGDLWASQRDAARALDSTLSMVSLPSWQHAGLLVASSPLATIEFARSGLQGIHHVTVTAESSAAAKQIWTSLQRAAARPCICSAWSEEAQLEEEVKSGAQVKSDTLAVTASKALYVPQLDTSRMEQKLRDEPEMHTRLLAAQGQYAIKYRLNQPYRKATIGWLELTGYNKADGKFTAERPVGESTFTAPKMALPSSVPATARTKLPPLSPGAYRILLDAVDAAGHITRVDERIYWFDGKVFEEM